METEKQFPIFTKTAYYLQEKASFFKTTISRLLQTDFNYELAERVCKTGLEISSNNWDEYFKHVDVLISLSLEFLRLQIKLEKTGRYLYSTFNEVQKNAYSYNGLEIEGPDYLWGLYFSEIFWKIHHNFTNFFLQNFATNVQKKGNILEVPLGTGFFLSEFLRNNPTWYGVGVDLANSAIIFSERIFNANKIAKESYLIIKKDFLEFPESEKFDRIICGEFLEHLEDPLEALKKFNRILESNGKIFLTVAVWAAHIDHIYLYTNANEVRNHIHEAGFNIEKELVQSVFEKDENDPEKSKIPVSYAAILTKN